MDERNSLDGRYSFNLAPINPVAESTHLNGSSFAWGSLCQKHRSYSSLCLNDSTNAHCNDGSNNNLRTKTKIDARIAADVQSKGLASRIVKYHESGTRLNRSISAHNLYSKPGQFPAVTLKKIDLPYRAKRQDLSMIRIPPPERSSFCGNTVSSLLRSNSVIGLQSKRNDDLSRENRPIIHPPPTENDMAPTRSVLDVLKEISRKRINSDDLESVENSKKYCNRSVNDFVDTADTPVIHSNLISTLSCQRYKRQRDCLTPQKGVLLSDSKTSPEQAKKRVCNYNNDIKSSLSSSLKWKIKSKSDNLNQTMPTKLESHKMLNSKEQYYESHKRKNNTDEDVTFENLEKDLRREDAIIPLEENTLVLDQINIGVGPTQTASEPIYNSDQKIIEKLIQPLEKPRLTLFNKKCDVNENAEVSKECNAVTSATDDIHEVNECADIPFVKPKKASSKCSLRNPVMERTQKSKLALMLSGLRGELYKNSDFDVLDSLNDEEKGQITKNNDNTDWSVLNSSNAITSLSPISTSCTEETKSLNISTISINAKLTPQPFSLVSGNKTSPLVGLKLSPSNSSSENSSNILGVDTKKSPEPQSRPNIPVLSGFSFCTTNTSPAKVEKAFPNILTGSKDTTNPISTISSKSLEFGQSTLLSSSLNVDAKNKLPDCLQPTTKASVQEFPTVCTVSTTIGSNPITSNEDISRDLHIDNRMPTSGTSTTIGVHSSFSTTANPCNVLSSTTSFPITAISSIPITLSSSTTTASSTETVSTTSATANALASSTVLASKHLGASTSTPLFTFNMNKKLSTSEPMPVSSCENSSVAFNIGGNPALTFGTNAETKTPTISSGFTFSSDTNVKNSSGEHTNDVCANRAGATLNSNNSTTFGSQCFNIKTNLASLTSNAFNGLNTKPIFDPNTIKVGIKPLEPSVNKSTALVTPTLFGNSTNNSTPTLFSFGSKSSAPTTASAGTGSTLGGFSFNSVVSNSEGSGSFNLVSTQLGQKTLTFSGVSNSASQNSLLFSSPNNKSDNSASIFGVTINKQAENVNSSGGFSFGSGNSTTNTTFSFGSGSNSGNALTSVLPVAKPNEISTNKSFSFGSTHSAQQNQNHPIPNSNSTSLNIFNLTGGTKTSQPPAFNFNSGNSATLQSNAPTANIFAASPSNISGTVDRPIRRATRRLQK